MASPRTINLLAGIGSDIESMNTQGQQAIAKLENIRDVQLPRLRDTINNSPHLDQAGKDEATGEADVVASDLVARITALYNSITP